MITVSDLSLKFSEKPLFKDVNLKFTKGNCYGIIGANGAGKSTFLKVLSGEEEHDSGEVSITPGERMAKLSQDHFAFDAYSVKETVMMGFPRLYEIGKEKDAIYEKPDFSEEDGIRASELEAEFGELGGYEAENQIEQMLSGLGLEEEFHDKMMSDLKEAKGYKLDTEITADELKELCEVFKNKVKEVLGVEFPDNAKAQLWGSIGGVFKSWNGKRAIAYRKIEKIPD